jgi:phosphoglycerate dehydrogenase-like enzyme
MMKVAFAGSFAARIAEPVRARLSLPCEVMVDDEAGIVPRLADVDVLVSMGFSARMAEAAPRLRLLQVPGAGLDRIDRSALRPGTHLANAYGHEAGIAEYIIGAMIALTRSFGRLDARLRQGQWESQFAVGAAAPPLWPELAGKTLGILGFGHIGQALVRRAAAFDMRVCAVRRQAQTDAQMDVPRGISFVGGPERIDDVLQQADYLAITLSLSPATSQESPHFDRHITAAWLAVTLWDAPCCSSRAVSLPRAIESTCPDRKRRSATGRHSILLRWNHEIKMRGCLSCDAQPDR